MKLLYLSTAFLLFTFKSNSQTIFLETFGQTTTRQTSAYMPSGSFTWGDPTGNNNQRWIENNHYAVIAPANIRDAWPTGNYWFWTGPQPTGYGGCDACNPATTDRTGNANGAVMVVNGGSTLNVFYQRQVLLVPGNSYRLSFYMYLVNSSSTVRFGVRDLVTKAVLGNTTTGFLSTEDNWVQYTYDFTYPAGCAANGAIEVFLSNDFSAFNGNDYYIDDIALQTIAGPATNISCPTSSTLPVKLESFTGFATGCSVALNWKSILEDNFKEYELEFSKTGNQFTKVKTIPAKGDNSTYTETHNPDNGAAYYRLKMIDNDGRSEYSKVVGIRLNCNIASSNVFPTVTNSSVTIQLSNYNGSAQAKLVSGYGSTVLQQTVKNNDKLSLLSIPKGVYYLVIAGEGLNKTHKIIIN